MHRLTIVAFGNAMASGDILPKPLASPPGKYPHWQMLSNSCPHPLSPPVAFPFPVKFFLLIRLNYILITLCTGLIFTESLNTSGCFITKPRYLRALSIFLSLYYVDTNYNFAYSTNTLLPLHKSVSNDTTAIAI